MDSPDPQGFEKEPSQVVQMAQAVRESTQEDICTLAISPSVGCGNKSRMMREYPVRLREGSGVKLPRSTRYLFSGAKMDSLEHLTQEQIKNIAFRLWRVSSSLTGLAGLFFYQGSASDLTQDESVGISYLLQGISREVSQLEDILCRDKTPSKTPS